MKSSERSIVYGTQEHESTAGRSAVAGSQQKLGVPPEQLRSELESGKYDKVLKNMSRRIGNAAKGDAESEDDGKTHQLATGEGAVSETFREIRRIHILQKRQPQFPAART